MKVYYQWVPGASLEDSTSLYRCAAAARAAGGSINSVYIDHGDDERDAFQEMWGQITMDNVTDIYTASMSALGLRVEGIVGLMGEVISRHMAIHFVDIPMAMTPSNVGLIMTIQSAHLNVEREAVRAQRRVSLARAKASGKAIGRPRKAFDIERARLMRDRGASLKAIARELHVGIATVSRRLHEE